jgi:hypothetical protein
MRSRMTRGRQDHQHRSRDQPGRAIRVILASWPGQGHQRVGRDPSERVSTIVNVTMPLPEHIGNASSCCPARLGSRDRRHPDLTGRAVMAGDRMTRQDLRGPIRKTAWTV